MGNLSLAFDPSSPEGAVGKQQCCSHKLFTMGTIFTILGLTRLGIKPKVSFRVDTTELVEKKKTNKKKDSVSYK